MKRLSYQKHLVTCPQCRKEALDHMETCPFCGGALKKAGGMTPEEIKRTRRALNIAGFILAAGLILWRILKR